MQRGRWILLGVFATGLIAKAELREMHTDRPDVTESPYTIDPGHLQIESSFFEYGVDRRTPEGNDTRATEWAVAPTNLRIGLTSTTELGIMIEPFARRKTEADGHRERASGVGDITIRPKFNFWGDDGGASAFGLMPFLKIPTHSQGFGSRRFEGGVIAPLAYGLSEGWDLGLMSELDLVRNGRDDGYTTVWLNTVTVGHELTKILGIYLELTSAAGEGPHALTFDLGVTYAVDENLQFDAGVNLALTRAAQDTLFFTGVSRRF